MLDTLVLPPAMPLMILTLAGLLAGWVVSRLSAALPRKPERSRGYRRWILPIVCALIGAAAALWAPSWLLAMFTAILGWQLVLIGLIDAENLWLPDSLTMPLAVTGVLANILLPPPDGQGWMASLLSAAIAFGALWLLAKLYEKLRGHRGLGAGDPILLGAGCAWVGLGLAIHVLMIASLVTLAVVILARLGRSPVSLKTRLPFGTFMAIGFAVCWVAF